MITVWGLSYFLWHRIHSDMVRWSERLNYSPQWICYVYTRVHSVHPARCTLSCTVYIWVYSVHQRVQCRPLYVYIRVYSVHHSVCTLGCTYSVHPSMCTPGGKLYTVLCVHFGVHCTPCSLYSVQCTVYSVQCTAYSVLPPCSVLPDSPRLLGHSPHLIRRAYADTA